MSMQDPVSDMLTQLRNAQMMGGWKSTFPHSNLKVEILSIEEGYIEHFEATEVDKEKLQVTLKYYQGKPVIEN